MTERRMNWTCREIDADGKPCLGFKVVRCYRPFEAAEAAEYFVETELHRNYYEDFGGFQDTRHTVEVDTEQGWKRFAVSCRVKLEYLATEVKP